MVLYIYNEQLIDSLQFKESNAKASNLRLNYIFFRLTLHNVGFDKKIEATLLMRIWNCTAHVYTKNMWSFTYRVDVDNLTEFDYIIPINYKILWINLL